jgi:hypothetical protein
MNNNDDNYIIFEEELNYREDNLGDFINGIYNYIEGLAENDLSDVITNNHLKAWELFRDTIGINYEKIYERWRKAPTLFISEHMQSCNITPIQELYNESVRAYVFGFNQASVTLCRALMEHILKKYYLKYSERKRIRLEDIISLAERNFEYLKKLRLKSKKNRANKVVHVYENREKMTEKAVLDFIQTIRYLVLDIQEKKLV